MNLGSEHLLSMRIRWFDDRLEMRLDDSHGNLSENTDTDRGDSKAAAKAAALQKG